ncbi:MAG: basic secretory family protein [Dysgonamonadaceae bacterium]|jgi:hypothetical protein|nr:basic secretory family protein [Dysgonamonadaceae bacterium]
MSIRLSVFLILLFCFAANLDAQPLRPLIVTIDTSDAPETQEWAEKIAEIAKEQYPHLVALLDSDGFTPTDSIVVIIRHMDGVGHAVRNQIHIAVNRVNNRPDDTGIVVHELIHIIQAYRFRGVPGWVTEGIADYLRFFYYERNGDVTCRINNLDRARYTDSYRTTAAFFDWIVRTYDAGFIKRLNAVCREGKFAVDFFKESTGKTVDELWDEFIHSQRIARDS